MVAMELEKYVLLNVGDSFEFNGIKGRAVDATTVVLKCEICSVLFDLSKGDGIIYLGSEKKAVFSLNRGYSGKEKYEMTIGINCSLVDNDNL